MAEVAKKVTGLGGITLALRPNEYPLVIEYRTSGFLKWRVVKSFGSAGVNEKRRFRTRKQAERYIARRTWTRA